MLRIAYFSDLHLEGEHRDGAAASGGEDGSPLIGPDLTCLRGCADVVVMAGDIARGTDAVSYANAVAKWLGTPVVLVPGNHEYYRRNRSTTLAAMRSLTARSGSRLHLLDTDAVVLDGVRFLGATLWTDFALHGNPDLAAQVAASNDFRLIEEDGAPLTPWRTIDLHRQSLAWLESRLADDFAGPTVVVSHHAPVRASIPSDKVDNILSAAFASDLVRLIESRRPCLWIHGHVHAPVDTFVGETRVVCNARGYRGLEPFAAGWRPRVVTLSGGAAHSNE